MIKELNNLKQNFLDSISTATDFEAIEKDFLGKQ